ncbi:MAG: MFS transporter [Chloroflexi bacterium]|nr:MFS transporter [Chloroflexota bacterium]
MTEPRMNRPGLALLSLGHFAVDVNQGVLPALLPVLFLDLNMNYASAAFVITVANLTSSIVQPIFGVVADKWRAAWLLPFGCFVACGSLAFASIAPSYPLLLLLVISMGLGNAIYHPESTRTANSFAGARRATGMALFIVGGNLGLAVGPVAIGVLVAYFGRPGGLGLLVLAVLVPLLFLGLPRSYSSAESPATSRGRTVSVTPQRSSRLAMVLLVAVVVFRQWAQFGLVTFVPLYFVNFLGESSLLANSLLSALFFGSVVGTLLGGPIADRWGRKPTLSGSLFGAAALLLVFSQTSGLAAMAAIFTAGVIMLMSSSVATVIGQELMPHRTGLAASLTVGFAAGIAGLGNAALGRVADEIGLVPVLLVVCLLPLPGALLSLILPDTYRRAPSLKAV